MPNANRHEQQFLGKLRDVFVGAQIEGESGYINLMQIKSRYYTDAVFPRLMADINAACAPFDPAFREELFDKLYAFFNRYFSESGSIYFRRTAYHQNVYERVYTDDRDVMLFWKTHMLYYVKTDRLFNNMEVTVDGPNGESVVFRFDVSGLKHKRANEKRQLVYSLRGVRDGKATLDVAYSERGTKTKTDDILKALRKGGLAVDEDTLARALRVFEKQSEVDYFINKNARAFLREQFDLWLYQYVFAGDTVWTATRLEQLAALKAIAYKIIDFIAQFEDELVKVWNKPKFVLNSHYIITLDKISDAALRERLAAHPGMAAQADEWRALGMVGDEFVGPYIDITGGVFGRSEYRFLPLDTRYFPELELDILGQFDDLDAALDGWLLHSENYQALLTLMPKYRGQIQVIYADPPYNSDASPIIYVNNYQSSTWLSMMSNRLDQSKMLLDDSGIICVTIDDNQQSELTSLLRAIFGSENIVGVVAVRANPSGRPTQTGFALQHEYIIFARNNDTSVIRKMERTEAQQSRFSESDDSGSFEWRNLRREGSNSDRAKRKRLFFPIVKRDVNIRIPQMFWDPSTDAWTLAEQLAEDEVVVYPLDDKGNEKTWRWGHNRILRDPTLFVARPGKNGKTNIYYKNRPGSEGAVPPTLWIDAKYSATEHGTGVMKSLFRDSVFSYPKSVYAVEDSIDIAGLRDDESLCLDFFAGSGTTAHAVINLNREDGGRRKYILVEMGEHFNSVILPRVKKVVFSDKWKDGRAQPGEGISHFAKYYDLEQYEDTLRRAHYDALADAQLTLLPADAYGPYAFLRDLRLIADTVTIDPAANKVNVRLDTLYPGIDLAETLSCVAGKGIRRVTREEVEFQDGTRASLTDPDWDLLKPLLWW